MSVPGMAVIVKPTYVCNAACDYCEVHKLGSLYKPMSIDTYSLLEKKLVQHFENRFGIKSAKVSFYWLGGEPLMMDDDFYKGVKDISDTSELQITHNMQSNLIPWAKKDFKYLKEMLSNYNRKNSGKYYFSTSIDPVSDARKLKNGSSYNEAFIQSLNILRKDGAKYGAVYTVHKDSIGREKEIYFYFKNLGFKAFNINAMCDYSGRFKDEDFGMTPKEYGEFLCKMWDVWESDLNKVDIIPFMSWKRLRDTGSSKDLRCFNDGKCNKTLCAVGPNGDVYTCDRAMQAKQLPLGNIEKDSFEEMFEKKYHQDRISYLKDNDCKDCQWWNYCKGSCPYESKGEYENRYDKSFWCEGYKILFKYIGA